jgi:hypothetical protein
MLIEGRKPGKGCVFYGTNYSYYLRFNKKDNFFVCREAFVHGKAISIHMGNAVKALGPAPYQRAGESSGTEPSVLQPFHSLCASYRPGTFRDLSLFVPSLDDNLLKLAIAAMDSLKWNQWS